MFFYNDNQLDSQLNNQLNNQFIVVKNLFCFVSSTIFVVLKLFPNLKFNCQLAFVLNDAENTWTVDEYTAFWFFVNNIWMHNHTDHVIKKKSKNLIDCADFEKMMLTQNLKVTNDVQNKCDTRIFAQWSWWRWNNLTKRKIWWRWFLIVWSTKNSILKLINVIIIIFWNFWIASKSTPL